MGKIARCSIKEKPSMKTAAVYVIGIIFGINALVMLSNMLPPLWGGIVSIGIIILTVLLTSYLINRKLAEYIYSIIDDDFLVFKKIGSREKLMLKVKLRDITEITPLKEDREKREKKVKRTYMFSCKLKGKGLYVGKFQEGKHKYRFIIQPNEGFLKALRREIKAQQMKEQSINGEA
ncbi:hypothetical protein [Isachenkonia alkalipeptolytica]|uniref:Uncharacterized protein n=1 Tax=Isachenkonia alkalipeptolytica TaxID=2565777 RepID=A0AA43XLN8_9CLOT|nr:hypothetical protein [Isachenkonia alkalipeptolytica]NBG89088.1 hypothetical protein [Isachenkonia alkalipeptolytica]